MTSFFHYHSSPVCDSFPEGHRIGLIRYNPFLFPMLHRNWTSFCHALHSQTFHFPSLMRRSGKCRLVREYWRLLFNACFITTSTSILVHSNHVLCSYILLKIFFLPELDVAFVDLDDSMRRCWWVRRYWIGVWFVIAARAAISRLNNGIFAFRNGKTNGRSGKFVTSCNTWWKSFTETVPAYFEI